jgi:predicted ATP-grasp superfamily ATP-dependent carboligase
MRILISEGASTSARQAITALGLKGHDVEICDPDPYCLGRFSRLIRRFHRCPGLGSDPDKYLSFILGQVSSRRFDVLLPIHEQGFLFAKIRPQILPHVAVALPSFESYEQVHSKVGFSRLLSELDLPQPETRFVGSRQELLEVDRWPFFLKAAVGTASRGTWMINAPADLRKAVSELERNGSFADPVLVQEVARGFVEHAQAVFCDGRLIGFHAYRQLIRGAGGGPALKESVCRPLVRSHLTRIGERLGWHGALSVDYIFEPAKGVPLYIDCNPRLVEPMSAFIAGLDLVDLLVRVSRGERSSAVAEGREGIRTHIAIQALLGCALRDASRQSLLRECWQLAVKRGPYAGSREELTPLRWDWPSALPLIITALWLLTNPKAAHYLPKKGWGSHLLNSESIRKIRRLGAEQSATAAG